MSTHLGNRWGGALWRVYRSFRFVRHDEPFAKRRAGRLRRQERRFRLSHKGIHQ